MKSPSKSQHAFVNLYRLQLNYKFPFSSVIERLEYFQKLGVDALYLSPVFQAKPKSLHGYDIVNPLVVSEDLGGKQALLTLSQKAKKLGISLVVDVVANHMSTDTTNPWWVDVLKHGKNSKHAQDFDISWDVTNKSLKNKVMLPVLEESYQESLELNKFQLCLSNHELWLCYNNIKYPLAISSYRSIIQHLEGIKAHRFCEAAADLTTISYSKKSQSLYQLWKEIEQGNLSNLTNLCQKISNDNEALSHLIAKQHYLFEYWRAAPKNINYRRFFDINELAAVSMQNKELFNRYHKLLIELIKEDVVQGVRIDHPDGFYSPREYFKWLQVPFDQQLYVTVEKILEKDEEIPENWQVLGSVGYEHLNMMTHLFINPMKQDEVYSFYEKFVGSKLDEEAKLFEEKRSIAAVSLRSEIDKLVEKLQMICKRQQLVFEDFMVYEALVCLFCSFPVYRTYLEKGLEKPSLQDKAILKISFAKAKSKCSYKNVLDELEKVFELQSPFLEDKISFVMRFQQICPSIMAKGFEDTHLYNNNKFLALNEVGGWLDLFGITSLEFHERMIKKLNTSPLSWITSSTHDTKRSEGVRLRLAALSECFDQFQYFCETLYELQKKNYMSVKYLDTNMIYFMYQTLVGLWPDAPIDQTQKKDLQNRLEEYFFKAAKESKAYTSWTERNVSYEHAISKFLIEFFEDNTSISALGEFVKPLARLGYLNVLSCMALKIGLPAALDTYQGTEWVDFALVDPDNRRDVDFDKREKALLENDPVPMTTNLEKMKLLSAGFTFRKANKDLIFNGEYIPINSSEKSKSLFVSYARVSKDKKLLVVARRFLSMDLTDESLSIPDSITGDYQCIITGQLYQINSNESLKDLLKDQTYLLLSSC